MTEYDSLCLCRSVNLPASRAPIDQLMFVRCHIESLDSLWLHRESVIELENAEDEAGDYLLLSHCGL